MIEIRNVQTIDGRRITFSIKADETVVIDGVGLTLLPGLIDPHVHFRTPGAEHKEDWMTAAAAAIAGGVTTVFDMPNNIPSICTRQRLHEKKKLIDQQLQKAKIPLRYGLYLGADEKHLNDMAHAKNEIVGLKIYMGSSTGDLLMKDPAALDLAFKIAAENGVLIAVHAEDEAMIEERQKEILHPPKGQCKAVLHSMIRSPLVAATAVSQAIDLAAKYGTRLYIAHVSTKEELDLIREAKKNNLQVFAEATPHHLFLNTDAYHRLDTCALVNPPLRENTDALWQAVQDGTIDTIGTDHAPHLLEEKRRIYGSAPSGFPSIELYLPLLLNAYHEKKITLEQIVRLTHTRPKEIFRIPSNNDAVLVDLNKKKMVDNERLKTKAKWSPYAGIILKGWPRYTILQGRVYDAVL